jgi:glutaredoxin
MTELTLLIRRGCHLCDSMKTIVATVQSRHPIDLTEIDVSNHPDLEHRFGTEIPVLLHGDRVLARYRVSATQLLERLPPAGK